MKVRLLFSLFLMLPYIVSADNSATLANSIAGQHRSQAHKARDVYRHPQQTLEFFDVQDNMIVVEIWPGGAGWYTEILAPYLKSQGTFYAAHFDSASAIPYFQKSLQQFKQKLADHPELYQNVIITELQAPDKLDIAPPASVDRVLTFRNIHNWMKYDQAELVFQAFYKALKPGGILGIVEHRSPENLPEDAHAVSGYVSEKQVIALAQQAGFTLLQKSEINANALDNAIHPKGVWSLPPSLKLGQQDKQKYLAIGESDRMTLKFIKPQ